MMQKISPCLTEKLASATPITQPNFSSALSLSTSPALAAAKASERAVAERSSRDSRHSIAALLTSVSACHETMVPLPLGQVLHIQPHLNVEKT